MANASDPSEIQVSICEKASDTNVGDDVLKSIVNDIMHALQLDDNDNKDQIVNDLLENGRQSLSKYQEDIIVDIYLIEMNDNAGKLIKLLKDYFEHKWEIEYSNSSGWFISFLEQYKKEENCESYKCVLTRTAEYGNKYMKGCPILSIVLQLLFEGIDDQSFNESNVFNDLWVTVTNDGLNSIEKYSDYITKDTMLELIEKKQMILFQALREYYRPELFKLLKESNIADRQNLYVSALDNVAEYGWSKGLQAVQSRMIPKYFKVLLEKIPTCKKLSQDIKPSGIVGDKPPLADVPPPSLSTETILKPVDTVTEQGILKISSNKSMVDATEIEQASTEDHLQQDKKTIVPIQEYTTDQDSIDDTKNELDIVSSCTHTQSDLFKLKDLVQAGELQYINKTLKDISEKLVENFESKHRTFPEFIQDCLTPIMYLSKRLQNLDDFLNTLTFKYQRMRQKTNHQLTETTNISLRMLLHVLFMSSDIFLRRIIMLLVSKRNPVPFISPNIRNWSKNEQYEFMPAVIHVWEYTRPTILSFGIGPCQGKSILLNQLFQSTFEQRIESIYFKQTIDIDFGYCFNPERTLNIADTHGIIDKKLLRKIQVLFDGFLIQIDKSYLDQHPQSLLEYVNDLPEDKFQMIIIRDTPNQSLQECSLKISTLLKQSEFSLSQKIHIYPLTNISNTNDRNIAFAIEDLREELLTKIKTEIPINNDRKDEILPNLKKLVAKDYVEYLKNMEKIIQPLKKRLMQKNEHENGQNFPLYLKFQELCKVRQKLKKLDFYGTESENMFDIYSRLSELESELDPKTKTSSPIKCGFIFDLFIEILNSDNMLMSLDLLASELKSELSSLGGDKLAGLLAVEHAFLSLEVLWRNAIVCYYHTTIDTQNLITKSYYDFVAAGFPFEIIDGDNFQFQQQFLTKILGKFTSERILVISIIGPQNSGKSTLLNYMFGSLFDVREGRCTRGVYGSLVKLPKLDQAGKKTLGNILNTNILDIDYIMLIDTEGLLGIEKGDKEYDRRLVLFSLAVSHLVIVNMMGDINETLKDMLTLCADSLKQIGANTTNQPIVHFVLNQKADPNLKNHMEAIEKIIKDLKEKELAGVIDISSKTFHTLPSAFKKERVSTDTKSPCFLRTEPDFIECTQQLCEKIIESAMSSYERTAETFSDPPQWLTTAVNIFDTLQKFPDLTYFKDINERRQDHQIRLGIEELITKKLPAAYRQQMIEDTCELTEHEIRKLLQAKFDVHQDDFDNDLENIFKVTNASDRIRDRCRQFLKRQVTEMCNAWCTAAIQKHDQRQMEGLVKDGSADLRNLIDDIIKSGKTMTKEEATQEFELMWKKKVESIKHNFNPTERLKQAIKFVYGNYNIFEKQRLQSHESILQYLQFIVKLSEILDLDVVITSIQEAFRCRLDELGKHTLEVCHKKSDANATYTLATMQNFKHLNKQILFDSYTANTVDAEVMDHDGPNGQSSSKKETGPAKKNFLRRGFDAAKEFVGVGSTTTIPSRGPLRFDFVKTISETIYKEMNKPNETSNILDVSKVFKKIVEDAIMLVDGNNRIRRPIEIDLLQKIVCLINTIINDVNHELLTFKLLLSKQTMSSIHTYILFLLIIFYYDEQKNHFTKQLNTLDEQKSSLLTYFISMIVPDAQCDKEGAELFADKVRNTVQSNLIRDAQKIIAHSIQTQQNLNRKQIQTICDGKLQGAVTNHKWLLRYIEAPTDIIAEEFQVLWKAVETTINQQLENKKKQWKNVLVEFFSRIEFMLSSLANEGSSVQYIDDIFEASGGNAADNLTNKGQCMALLLYAYLSGNKIKEGTSYPVFDKKYTLKPKGLKLFEKLPLPSQQLIDLMKGMKDVHGSNNKQMAIASIKNLSTFLQSTINAKRKVEDDYERSPATFATFDKDQIYNKLLDKARGCISKCPCCDRPCDVDHSLIKSNAGNEDNRHACQTGHQLRAMAGIKFEVSDEASLFQCEQMEDNQPIIVRGTKKKWSEFKADNSDWDFDNSIPTDELFKLRGKFLNVWSKIGEDLCKKYQMKFVRENTYTAPKPVHYILLLDASGSMRGKPWTNLLNGVKDFISIRIDACSADRITIIVFADNASYGCFNVDIKAVDMAQIKFTSGGTNFSNAFNLVVKTIETTASNSAGNLDFIIIFMSDGQAERPDTQLNKLLTMKAKISQFWTVALGDTEMNVLEYINQKMGGIFKELKDSDDLANVYAEIARN